MATSAPMPAYVFKGRFIDAHDGDNATIALDHGRFPKSRAVTEAELRNRGVFCPELHKPGGPEAREFTYSTLAKAQKIIVQTYKGSFERTVADIWVDGELLADLVIAAGHGTATPPA